MPKRTAPWMRRCQRPLCWPVACASLCALAHAEPMLPAPGGLEVSSDGDPLPYTATQRVDVTHWMPGGLGLSVGLATQANAAPAALAMAAPLWQPTLGVHWRTPLSGGIALDLSTWASLSNRSQPLATDMIWQNRPPQYGTRLEVQWRSSRMGGLAPEFGAIGVRLEGDSQLLLRTRKGGPMVYYRTKF
ncbi:MAG: hypothetical protein QM740_14760 [Acidovorax sp.]